MWTGSHLLFFLADENSNRLNDNCQMGTFRTQIRCWRSLQALQNSQLIVQVDVVSEVLEQI